MKSIGLILLSILATLIPLPASSQSDEDLQRTEQLDQRCRAARAAKLRVLQQQKIEQCLKEPKPEHGERMTRAECERYWSDYGWGAGKPGARSPRFFENIPECVAADKARRQYRAAD